MYVSNNTRYTVDEKVYLSLFVIVVRSRGYGSYLY